ncbi:MAG: S-layer homology domain-containing protein, partial [Clostridia bacterium]|nr:S-layer homology domain-containing protein [Clostridia bacterium]
MKNFKKVISVVMALAMIVCSFTAVSASDFADVADTAAYAEAVEVLGALGIVNGVEQENGTFNFEPEKSVTRAEAATMIVGALNMADAAAAGTSQFADVNSQAAWAAGFVNVGVAQGFIAGYDANTFGPLDNVTYAQMCVMLTKITGYGEYAQAYGGWPTGYTTMAATAGINTGVAVAQDAALTKGQVAMMIWNALQAPMLGVETYAINGNEYKPLDGTDGKFKTLFSEKFDGYVATMTIMKTPASDDNLDNDEVNVKVVKADWWPLEKAKYPSKDLEDGKVPNMDVNLAEGVDVNSNLLHTGKAVYLLDEDEEITIVYFAPTGRTASKELAADTYYLQKDLHADKQYTADNLKIRFGSSYYKFEDTITVYVNGVDAATIKAGETTKLDNILG